MDAVAALLGHGADVTPASFAGDRHRCYSRPRSIRDAMKVLIKRVRASTTHWVMDLPALEAVDRLAKRRRDEALRASERTRRRMNRKLGLRAPASPTVKESLNSAEEAGGNNTRYSDLGGCPGA